MRPGLRDSVWWNMGGPSRFLDRAAGKLMDGKSVILAVPPHSPSDLLPTLRFNLKTTTHLDHQVISLDAGRSLVPNLLRKATPPGTPVPKTLAGLMAAPFAQRMVFEIHFCDRRAAEISKDLVPRLIKAIERGQSSRRHGPRFLLVLQQPSMLIEMEALLGKTLAAGRLHILGWRGCVNEADMVGYIGALMHDRVEPLPYRLFESYVQVFSAFDVDLADWLHDQSDQALFNIGQTMQSYVQNRPLTSQGWAYGSQDEMPKGHLVEHPVFIFSALCAPDASPVVRETAEIQAARLKWRAQLRVLFPWLESVRVDYLRHCYGEQLERLIEQGAANSNEEPYRTIDDFEYADVQFAIRSRGLSNQYGDNQFVRLARDARNSLAHREPVAAHDLISLNRAWHETAPP